MLIIFLFLINQTLFETEEKKDFEVILSELENLRENPVDLNTASLEEFLKIPFLKYSDALKILAYREKAGPFEKFEELYKIPGLDSNSIEEIRPFLAVKKKPVRLKGIASRLRFKRNLKEKKSEEYYTNTKTEIGDYKIYLVTEKDPYEISFFDYYSTGVLIDEGKRRFALGKYNLNIGSGVMLSSVGSFFSGIDYRILTHKQGIIPHTSVMENGGFFGAAVSDSLFLNYCLFYSHQRLDGRIDTSGYARSFDESGNHIDSLSIARKDRIEEEIFGYDIQYRYKRIQLSNHTYLCNYEPPFVCEDSLNQFYGKSFWISGLELKYFAERFIIFSEFARSFQNRTGGIFGWSGILPYNLDFNLSGKFFSPNFYSPKGIESDADYIGVVFDLNHHSILDVGTTLNINTDNEVDTTNYDLRLNLNKNIGFTQWGTQFRWFYKEGNRQSSGTRVSLRLLPKRFLYFGLRLEERYNYQDSLCRGILGGIESGLETKFFKLIGRYSLFDIDDYAVRIFVYEPDLPGIINNRVFYGQGNSYLVYLSINPYKGMNISLKYFAMEKDSLSQQIGFQLDSQIK
uniref:Helix-hairpin-helix domain-containing protein n=1 Tax=candidate division WOR-3 bacterium TaxID=2052148 RepID=A0A7C4TDP1_UNCW3